ncbi:hypothetical protein OGAPHI_006983 [Ogataea philodendri]|uniref:Uncharacterized protein n=1 Tax=Ogataea philodendri TaxID=1378263 RepID=A0A9P8NVW1_9ASCO|nr:uncharacterized protein OGAPHI_006983 [Ogataea philodendri]KAH3660397.1 hypothetical protein OGAPHI_006983 [Ogataea philodendri]
MAPRRRNLGIATASAIVVVGAASLVVSTYPHLLEKLPWWKSQKASDKTESEETKESKETVGDSTVVVPAKDLSETELKQVLKEVGSN